MGRPRKEWEPIDRGEWYDIPLSRGLFAMVDKGDYEKIKEWGWFVDYDRCSKKFYARGRVGVGNEKGVWGKPTLMHRMIVGAGADDFVDHRNMNTLDNRRSNLRICSRSENGCNRGLQSNNTTGVKGVQWKDREGRFMALITVAQKPIYLGFYKTLEEAATVVAERRRLLHGEFARDK